MMIKLFGSKRYFSVVLTLLATVLLVACPLEVPQTFEITLVNLTHNQPLSPPVYLFHTSEYRPWQLGEVASVAIEKLAESGDSADLLTGAEAEPTVLSALGEETILIPGGQHSRIVTVKGGSLFLSVAAMLVNTNDAFAALEAFPLNQVSPGDEMRVSLYALDAGTEENSESITTVPGPAAGGEGFNPEREIRNIVRYHPGVVSQEDGLVGSVLDQSHRFDNPVAQLVIRRL